MEKRIIKKFPEYTITEDGVIYDSNNNAVKTFINAAGHVAARLNDRIVTVAYLVANTWLNNDNFMCVGFADNDRTNIKASNLYWYYEGEEELQQSHFEHIYFNKEKYVGLIDINGNVVRKYICAEDAKADWDVGRITNAISSHKLIDGKYIFVRLKDYKKETFERDYKQYFFKKREYNKLSNKRDRTIYNNKRVVRYDLDGNVIKEYNNIIEAANELRGYKESIVRCCRGDLHTSLNSVWRFEGDTFDKYNKMPVKIVTNPKPIEESINDNIRVVRYDLNGDKIKAYNSITEAAEETKTNRYSIIKVCNGILVTSANSIWRYENDAFDKYDTKDGKFKSILLCDLNGNILNEFISIKDAAEQTGIAYNTITNCLYKRQKTVHKKYRFKYKE